MGFRTPSAARATDLERSIGLDPFAPFSATVRAMSCFIGWSDLYVRRRVNPIAAMEQHAPERFQGFHSQQAEYKPRRIQNVKWDGARFRRRGLARAGSHPMFTRGPSVHRFRHDRGFGAVEAAHGFLRRKLARRCWGAVQPDAGSDQPVVSRVDAARNWIAERGSFDHTNRNARGSQNRTSTGRPTNTAGRVRVPSFTSILRDCGGSIREPCASRIENTRRASFQLI